MKNPIFISMVVMLVLCTDAFTQDKNGNVTVEKDIVYGKGSGRDLLLDIAYPKERPDKPMPVVVWIHGGAWRGGSKDNNHAMIFVKHGFFTASISYRLSGEAVWPAQINDCKAAIRYLRAHAEQYHLDPDCIGVWGASAGGHLVAMLGTSGDVKELEGEGGWQEQSSRVQAVVDYYGPSNFLKMKGQPSNLNHLAEDSPESLLLGASVTTVPDKVKSADPITYISKDDPPFLIAHGDQDNTVPFNQSEILLEALQKAGVESELIVVKGGGHGGWNDKTQPTNQEITEKVVEFFMSKLTDQK